MATYTPNKGYPEPLVGGDKNQWGTLLNQGLAILDKNMGSAATIAVGGSVNVTATAADAQNLILNTTGTLTGNISYLLPAVGTFGVLKNDTSGAYSLTVKTVAGGSTGIPAPQGQSTAFYSDGTNVYPLYGDKDGGLTLSSKLTIAAGGANITGDTKITGNSTITGIMNLGSILTVAAGGAQITGNSGIAGALTVSTPGTTGTQIPNYSQFSPGTTASYQTTKLPGGLRLLIGTEVVTPTGTFPNGSATLTFPVGSFSNYPFIVPCNGSASLDQTRVNLVGGNSAQFVVSLPDWTSGDVTVNYVAFGLA